jgi:hypothetical protein
MMLLFRFGRRGRLGHVRFRLRAPMSLPLATRG